MGRYIVNLLGSHMFINKLERFKTGEIKHCNNLAYDYCYLTGSGPYGEFTEGFRNLLESGKRVKFVISNSGVFIGKPSISHASIAGFQKVVTAGHVRYTKSIKFDKRTWGFKEIKRLKIDNETGHYQVTVGSLKKAVCYFKSKGYAVSVEKCCVTVDLMGLNSLCIELIRDGGYLNTVFLSHELYELSFFIKFLMNFYLLF